jgi:uncharacterized protein YegP (UPF0339 family)
MVHFEVREQQRRGRSRSGAAAWRWRLVEGDVVLVSSDTNYATRAACERAINDFRDTVAKATTRFFLGAEEFNVADL